MKKYLLKTGVVFFLAQGVSLMAHADLSDLSVAFQEQDRILAKENSMSKAQKDQAYIDKNRELNIRARELEIESLQLDVEMKKAELRKSWD